MINFLPHIDNLLLSIPEFNYYKPRSTGRRPECFKYSKNHTGIAKARRAAKRLKTKKRK